ncbi:Vacuolar transporter chaperone 4 [Picochlorum sp. SENEW3]|nr:Vacuolar transporter chaperone 4 [Picochlorum sp. SENEW3]
MVKFGNYLETNQRPEWKPYYINYKALKDLIKLGAQEAATETVGQDGSPRETSLSVVRAFRKQDSAEERFFKRLEAEVSKVGAFTAELVSSLRNKMSVLQAEVAKVVDKSRDDPEAEKQRQALLEEAKKYADEFLALEKYVNLNYMGFHKILKKHDKNIPTAPCRQFYVAHLHNQPWVQGNYSDLMVQLSVLYSQVRGDQLAEAAGGSAQAFKRSTTKYWIKTDDVTAVKKIIIENMPVFVFNPENYTGDSQLVNSVYFDNESLELYHGRLDKKPGALAIRIRWYGPNEPKGKSVCFVERKTHRESWKGEKSIKERFTLPEERIVPYIEGEYTVEEYADGLRAKGKSEAEVEKASILFMEIQRTIEAKQLKPFVRTQYMRSAFQMGHDRTVSFTLDTNLIMLKENPEGHPTCSLSGRWYRDPKLPIHRTEITKFPHAVLEIKLALPDGEAPPEWVQNMMSSGLITEVHKMSKFIHGTAVLFPELVQAVPYWIDDESIRESIKQSGPDPNEISSSALDANAAERHSRKPRRRGLDPAATLNHPLLGEAPTLALMQGSGQDKEYMETPWWNPFYRHDGPRTSIPQRLEPKTFLASERTFLSWLHMAITLSSIAAALLAFASTAKKTTDPMHALSKNLVEFIALMLLPLGVFIVAYALMVFLWRNSQIALKQASYIDDRRGPLLLATLVVSALSAIFVVSCMDLYDQINSGQFTPSPAPPVPASPPAMEFMH